MFVGKGISFIIDVFFYRISNSLFVASQSQNLSVCGNTIFICHIQSFYVAHAEQKMYNRILTYNQKQMFYDSFKEAYMH